MPDLPTPTYRVEPDAEFADRLERLLLHRLTAVRDDGDRKGDIIMLETEIHPADQEPQDPDRRDPRRWRLAAAAVAAIAVGGALVAAISGDDGDDVGVADTPPTTLPPPLEAMQEDGALEPGRYFVDPDGDAATSLRVTFDVPVEGWESWPGAYRFVDDERTLTSMSITTVSNLVTHGCTDHRPLDPPVGATVDDLATALAQLAPFEVVAPPTDVTLFGYSGKHLELAAPDLATRQFGREQRFADCEGGDLKSWISPVLGGAFWGYSGIPSTHEEIWILDVHGTRLMLVKLHSPTSPGADVAVRDQMFDSIRIEP